MKEKKILFKKLITTTIILITIITTATITVSTDEPEYTIYIKATTEECLDSLYFGEGYNAQDGQDSFDVPKPPSSPMPFIYMFFPTDWEMPYDKLLKDYRQYPDETKTWNFTIVYSEGVGDITLKWNNVIVYGTEYATVLLKDLTNDVEVNMKTYDNYTFEISNVAYFQIYCVDTMILTELSEGWNMKSIPLQTSIAKEDVMVGYNDIVYTWDEAVENEIIIDTVYGWEQTYYECNIFQPGEAYWLYAYESCTLQI